MRTARSGGSPGDVGLLKAELFGVRTPPAIAERLSEASLDGYLPEPKLTDLRRMARGTLGREYAELLADNDLQPFFISSDLRPRALQHTYLMRYIATHDFIHLVTGFDTGWAGELGVLAATVEQGFAPGGTAQEWAARVYYPARDFANRKAIRRNRRLGHVLGRDANYLLTYRYEDNLERPLAVVRRELKLPSPEESGIAFPIRSQGVA
ncbi:MAG: Coq4 family protein [Myxococcota bacterium]